MGDLPAIPAALPVLRVVLGWNVLTLLVIVAALGKLRSSKLWGLVVLLILPVLLSIKLLASLLPLSI